MKHIYKVLDDLSGCYHVFGIVLKTKLKILHPDGERAQTTDLKDLWGFGGLESRGLYSTHTKNLKGRWDR